MNSYSSKENIKMMIECFIDSALKKVMSWDILASVIDNMTSTLNKSKEVIKIFLGIIRDKEEPIDEELQIIESNDSMDQNPAIIGTEEKVNKSIKCSTSDASDCQVFKDQFLESSIDSTEDSRIGLENNSQNDEVLVEATVDVSTHVQIMENFNRRSILCLT